MALSTSSTTIPNLHLNPIPRISTVNSQTQLVRVTTKCELEEVSSSKTGLSPKGSSKKLEIGSPIIVTEAPRMLKTAASVPCLRANSGLVKPGDVGRIVSRKPKDVWAVRLTIGTYLIDGKYFKPLELEE